uniref:Uncharacterized protein n=1 Tax=Kalanchoe fedtschenkoi TaxID=63787 RepID=A0A7N0ULH7_KALFE
MVLMLDIKDIFKVDEKFYFLKGLKPWAITELNRQNNHDLASPITRLVSGVAKNNVQTKIGEWKGPWNFSLVSLDDGELISGLEFMRQALVVPMPFVYILPFAGDITSIKSTSKELYKVMRKQIDVVLREFEDVMPNRVPKELSLWRSVDHEIELLPEMKPPARGTYQCLPPELAELQKQLGELLEIDFIHLLKSPFGAPMLFQKKAFNKITVCNHHRISLIS